MYGPYDAPNKFIPSVIEKLKNNESSIDTTNGEQTRDFIYVSDVVDTYKLLLGKETKLSKYSEFDIGTGKEFSIKDTILLIKDITNSSTKINFGKLPYRENELMKSKANIGGLLNLGWKPKFELRDGIKKTWVKLRETYNREEKCAKVNCFKKGLDLLALPELNIEFKENNITDILQKIKDKLLDAFIIEYNKIHPDPISGGYYNKYMKYKKKYLHLKNSQ